MTSFRYPLIVAGALVLSAGPVFAQPAESGNGVSQRERFSGPLVTERGKTRAATLATAAREAPPIVNYQEMSLRPGLRITGSTRAAPAATALTAALPLRTVGGFLLYELRAGKLATVINGERKEREAGEFWIVGPTDDVTLETADDSVVLQTIQLPDK